MAEKDPALAEGILSHIRNIINQNGIRLWEAPYYNEDQGSDESKLLELSCNLAPTLDLSDMSILEGLRTLQENALDKLKAREKLQLSGMIVLRLKIAKNIKNPNGIKSVEVPSNATTAALYRTVGNLLNINPENLRLITGGNVLFSSEADVINLKPSAVLMILEIQKSDENLKALDEQGRILEGIKNDAEILGDRLEIGDQGGASVDLSGAKRKALVLAISLHEKGRSALKKQEYSIAMVLLLEADKEYKNCPSDLLKGIDNYALLNLDIAWCYLKLEQLSELPQAEKRLMDCEMMFHRCYGANLERLQAVKGTTGNEAALFMRLHLLQGIVAFHQGHRHRAKELLNGAQRELKVLQVSQDSIDELKALGYSEMEARLGLRASGGNIPDAAKYILHKREEIERVRKEERERKKKQRKFGKTADGESYVNFGYYKTMMAMGFPEDLVVSALRQTNNDITQAIDLIQKQPDLLMAAVLSVKEDEEMRENQNVPDEMIAQITEMGFANVEAITKALNESDFDVEKTIETLTEDKERKAAAYSRMKEVVSNPLEDHLDLRLTDEAELLDRYKALLES